MNIFATDDCPTASAINLCDAHLRKMLIETGQIMRAVLDRHGVDKELVPLTSKGTRWRVTHKNHPSTIWAGDDYQNYGWVATHALAMIAEYKRRFGKVHACSQALFDMAQPSVWMRLLPNDPSRRGLDNLPMAMPDEYKTDDPVEAYRTYYISKQYTMGVAMKWTNCDPPVWFIRDKPPTTGIIA